MQRALVESGAMLTFLNDGNPGDGDAVPALQMLGVHGSSRRTTRARPIRWTGPKPRCGPADWQTCAAAATCPTSWRDAS